MGQPERSVRGPRAEPLDLEPVREARRRVGLLLVFDRGRRGELRGLHTQVGDHRGLNASSAAASAGWFCRRPIAA